jgi:hypothetical protein
MTWARLRAFRTLPEAWLAHSALLREGLTAEIRGEARAPLAGEIPFADARVEVWVIAAQLDAAAELLAEVDRTAEGPARKCAACGEDNPPAFEVCWNCGGNL